jgi:hypothetical protein
MLGSRLREVGINADREKSLKKKGMSSERRRSVQDTEEDYHHVQQRRLSYSSSSYTQFRPLLLTLTLRVMSTPDQASGSGANPERASALPKAIGSMAKKAGDTTRLGGQKMKFVPTLPARRKKE